MALHCLTIQPFEAQHTNQEVAPTLLHRVDGILHNNILMCSDLWVDILNEMKWYEMEMEMKRYVTRCAI